MKVLGRFGRLADGSSSWYVHFGFMAGRLHQRNRGSRSEVIESGRGWNVRPDSLEQKFHDGRRRAADHLEEAAEQVSGVTCGIRLLGQQRTGS